MRSLIAGLMMAGTLRAMGGVGETKTVNYEGARTAEHEHFFKALEHEDVQLKLKAETAGVLRPVEYATQVVQGLKYIAKLKDEQETHYEVHIWQKPFNSVKNEMPSPEVIKLVKLTPPVQEL